ncbi:hypothetical protein ABZU76_16115 [Amycolatopsis sp. NPDC005232]|uniref:hypothetical protein n=1 Tax=Amycolatopsis sp. NPDC005232 TaxID=3157027 RepID=UPI00339DED77
MRLSSATVTLQQVRLAGPRLVAAHTDGPAGQGTLVAGPVTAPPRVAARRTGTVARPHGAGAERPVAS